MNIIILYGCGYSGTIFDLYHATQTWSNHPDFDRSRPRNLTVFFLLIFFFSSRQIEKNSKNGNGYTDKFFKKLLTENKVLDLFQSIVDKMAHI